MIDKDKVAGVYETHAEAVEALQFLQDSDYPVEKKVSIVGHGEIVEENLHLYSATDALKVSAGFGAIIGGVLGALVGLELLMFPGAHLIPLGGAPMGILTGFGIGLLLGSIIGGLIAFVIGPRGFLRMKKHFEMTDYVLVIKGSLDDVIKARKLLGTEEELDKTTEEFAA